GAVNNERGIVGFIELLAVAHCQPLQAVELPVCLPIIRTRLKILNVQTNLGVRSILPGDHLTMRQPTLCVEQSGCRLAVVPSSPTEHPPLKLVFSDLPGAV